MSACGLIVTYHGVGPADPPLSVDAATFAAHLDCIVASDYEVSTVSELADALRAGPLRRPTLAITFDDGFASVPRIAAPLLEGRDLRATVYCVAGHLGGRSDWPSARPETARHELARADELAALTGAGWEIGCHGMTHAPLVNGADGLLARELLEAKDVLEHAGGVPVRSFAYPYGAGPSSSAHRLVAETYASACSTRLGYVGGDDDLWALPRIDVHFIRGPRFFRAALARDLGPYLTARALGTRARRKIRPDYALAG
jgi:peptidoglycan/xylan/chitin deacetylase (PgdA/CDA1 family)